MKKAKPYRNWLVWWLQQKRKERNGSVGAWYSTIAGILGFYEGTKYTDVDIDNDGTDESCLLSNVGSSDAPVLKSQSHACDGSAYITLPSTITVSGNFTCTFGAIYGAANMRILGATGTWSNQVVIASHNQLQFYGDDGVGKTVTFPTDTFLVGSVYDIILTRTSGVVDATVNDISSSSSASGSTADIDFNLIGAASSARATGNLWDLKVTDSSGNVVLDCPGTNAVGTSIPMQINGVPTYGTLTGATLPDFYAEHQDGLTGFNPNELGYSARENLLKGSSFDGTISGTPGTPPDNWYVSTGDGSIVYDSVNTTIQVITTNARHIISQTGGNAVEANTEYYFTGLCTVGAEVVDPRMGHAFNIAVLPAGASLVYYIDGVESTINSLLTSGTTHRLTIKLVVAGTAGTVYCQFGAGVNGVQTGDYTFKDVQFTTDLTKEYVKTTDTPIQGIQPAPGYDTKENLFINSEALTAADRASFTANATTAPDGTNTADKLVEDSTASNTHRARLLTDLQASTGYTYHIRAKAAERSEIITGRSSGTYINSFEHTFDLSAGTASGTGATIEGLGDGWYLCSGVFTTTATAGNAGILVNMTDGSSAVYDGDGSSGLYLWGAHLHRTTVSDTYIKTTDSPITQITPNYSKDILGNTLQYLKPKLSSKYTGYTGAWDGTAYGVLDETVTLSGDFKVELSILPPATISNSNTVVLSSSDDISAIKSDATELVWARVGGSWVSSTNTLTGGSRSAVSLQRIGTDLIFTIDGNSNTKTVGTDDFVINYISKFGLSYNEAIFEYLKIYNYDDTLIHHWVVESSSTSEQSQIFDVVGGNHATLTSATLPFFTTESEEATYLMLNGWTEGEPDGVELSATVNGSNATNTITALGDNTFEWKGDGSSFTYIRFTPFVAGKRYKIIPTVLSRSAGEIKGNDTTDSDMFTHFYETPDPIEWVANTKIEFGRYQAGAEIDIVVQFSIQEIPTGYIPAKAGEVVWTPDGVELVTNGDASDETSTDSSVSALAGWVNVGTHDANNKFTISNGQFTLISDGTLTQLTQAVGNVGETVKFTVNVISVTGGGIRFQDASTSFLDVTEAGEYEVEYTITSSLGIKRLSTATTVVYADVSVQKMDSSLGSASGSALGQPLTANPNDLRSFEPGYIEMPQDKRLINADVVSQYGAPGTNIFTASAGGFSESSGVYTCVSIGDASALDTAELASGDSAKLSFRCTVSGNFSYHNGVGYTSYVALTAGESYSFISSGVGSAGIFFKSSTNGFQFDSVTLQKLQDPISFFFEPDGDQRQIEYEDLLPTYGDELATNGGPFTDTTGWTAYGSTLSVVNEHLRVTSDGTSGAQAYQTISASSGDVFQLSFDSLQGTAGARFQVSGGTIRENGSAFYLPTSDGSTTLTIDATGSVTIRLVCQVTTATFYADYNNISVKEITATGANVNDQYFFSDCGLVICDEPQDEEVIEAIEYQLEL